MKTADTIAPRRAAGPVAALLALALAACSPPARVPAGDRADQAANGAAAATMVAEPPTAAGATVGGDGSEIVLSALAAADMKAAPLSGELACAFTDTQRATLLIARGDVASAERAFGLIKIAGHIETVSAPGGFDAMLDGAIFAGKGTTIRIAPTGGPIGGGESPPRPATLTFDRADGARRVFDGQWTCGP